MSVTTTHRPASTDEIAAEIDRRGQVIEHLEVRNDELTKALIGAERAITEFYRYYTGGETRGSYDGRPEREGLWKAMRAARSTLAALVPAPQPVGEVRAKELPERFVEDYVDGYDFRFDNGGGHTPSEAERAMLIDFGYGLISELSPAPSSQAQEDGR